MNIFRMIGPALWFYFNLRHLNKFKRGIDHNRAIGNYEEERKNILGATSTWGSIIVKHFNVDLNVEGRENIPAGPVLFVSNHQGYADIIAFCASITNKQFGFVAKKNLGSIPIFGRWIERIRSIFLERSEPREALKVINQGVDYLEKGFSLVIFPEGTRSLSDHMGKFKRGSLRLAVKSKLPIVPVTVSGTWKVFEEKGHIQKNRKVRFYIHPSIETKDLSKKEGNELSDKVEQIIKDKLEEFNGNIQ